MNGGMPRLRFIRERAVTATEVSAGQAVLFRDSWREGPSERASVRTGLRCAQCDRIAHQRDADPVLVDSPEAAADLLLPAFVNADRERCVAAYVDTKHRVLSVVTISIGSIDHTFMSPREVFRDALLTNAAAVVLAHNHPSGDPEPSSDDMAVSRRLARSGSMIGVEVLDHLVIGDHRWVSLARRGAL